MGLRTVGQVAEFCGASERTIWRALLRGELACLGWVVRSSDQQLDAWLARSSTDWPSTPRR